MAEVLGAVASGVAVADLAGKLIYGLMTLKGLWDQVKDVPNTVECLMAEIEILLPLVQRNSFEGCEVAKSYALNAIGQLVTLVSDLSNDIGSARGFRKHLAKVHVALKADVISRYEKRLQSAVRLLMMAQQCYAISLQETQADSVVEKLLDKVNSNKSTSSSSLIDVNSLLSIPVDARADPPSTISKARSHVAFSIPFSGYQFHLQRSYCGWQFNLRPYTVFPSDYEWKPLRLIAAGSDEELFRLFDTGEASPFDRSPTGKTYLFYAFNSPNPSILQRLLEIGVDQGEQDDKGYTFSKSILAAPQEYHKANSLRHYLFSIDQGFDNQVTWYLQKSMSSDYDLYKFYIDTEFRRKRVTKEDVFRDCEVVRGFDWVNTSQVRYVLQVAEKCTSAPPFEPDPTCYYFLFARVIGALSIRWSQVQDPLPWSTPAPGTHEEWRQLVHDVLPVQFAIHWIRKGKYFGHHYYPWDSPVCTFILSGSRWHDIDITFRKHLKHITKAIQFWAAVVHESGACLAEYGEREMEAYENYRLYCARLDPNVSGMLSREQNQRKQRDYYLFCQRRWTDVCAMKTGPLPEDWGFEWKPQVEKFVGDFFEIVEDPQWNRHVPGAWREI
ncbi:uncharacterized protein MKZ38_007636 [Zalerion maritima]|uniref:NACHT-NTPase and P-loop NTPases N-terminal domain-containing protein n=1 Tax=Zalerion maritima TaxID=339359 RepID=A0AAD5S0P7_9PEZI|nr:uncharacterized protein MKZ38_007636 [Zalerion maritima]